jgi:predicted ATP-dependent serine protease
MNRFILPMPVRVAGRDVAVQPRRRVGVVSARELRPSKRRAPYTAPWDTWQIGDPHAVELLGPPGGGKSTAATCMAITAARRIPVLYVAAEEGHGQALIARLHRAGLDDIAAQRLRVSDARTMAELDDDLRAYDARLVVIDSISEIGAPAEQMVSALLGRSWIAVSHINGRGQSFGGQTMSHAVDVVIRVEGGVAAPSKNRFGPMNSINVWEAA